MLIKVAFIDGGCQRTQEIMFNLIIVSRFYGRGYKEPIDNAKALSY